MVKRHIKDIRDYFLIRKSSMFDPIYYLVNYEDVRLADIDPLWHYIRFGWKEGRNPSPVFSVEEYLHHYPDVLEAGINPVAHFLRFGRKEGRAFGEQLSKAVSVTQDKAEVKFPPVVQLEDLMKPDELIEQLKKNLRTKSPVISLAHDDYLSVIGGIQVFVARRQYSFFQVGGDYLFIFPRFRNGRNLGEDCPIVTGVILNGTYLGAINSDDLIKSLAELGKEVNFSLEVHHILGFPLSFLNNLSALVKNELHYWIHDFFSICPSCNLFRNGKAFCWAPAIDSNMCKICVHKEDRGINTPLLKEFFRRNTINVIAPSEFALNFWKEKTELESNSEKVKPNLRLQWSASRPVRRKKRLNIAFLGYPALHKGWRQWMKLVQMCSNDSRYKFYHFGSKEEPLEGCTYVPVTVTPDVWDAMRDKVEELDIDIAILWSIIPETFSITLHEAVAGGAIVLTNPDSGNIAYSINKTPSWGMVIEEEELMAGFQDGRFYGEILRRHKHGKHFAQIEWSSR